jgi:hypothetical protein
LSSLPPVLQTHESTKQKDSVQLDGSFNPRNVKEEIALIKRNSLKKDSVQLDGSFNPRNVKEEIALIKRNSLKEVEIDSKQESKTYKNFQASIPFYRLY